MRPDLLKLACGAGNFSKIWYECVRNEIQDTIKDRLGRRMCNYVCYLAFVYLCTSCVKNVRIIVGKIILKSTLHCRIGYPVC